MSRGSTLLFGLALGALGVVLYQRLRKVMEDEDAEALAERLSADLQALEKRIVRS